MNLEPVKKYKKPVYAAAMAAVLAAGALSGCGSEPGLEDETATEARPTETACPVNEPELPGDVSVDEEIPQDILFDGDLEISEEVALDGDVVMLPH